MTSTEFIFEYLKADQDTGSGSYEKMYSLIQSLDWSEIKAAILKLKYFYFLKTSYWQIISAEVKRRSGYKCICGCREELQVHHNEEGNEHHGEEHLLIGLVCLCSKCHNTTHNTSIKNSEKKRQRNNKKEQILDQLPFYPKRVSSESISGSSFTLTRKLLEELEHDRKIVINKDIYEGWMVYRT